MSKTLEELSQKLIEKETSKNESKSEPAAKDNKVVEEVHEEIKKEKKPTKVKIQKEKKEKKEKKQKESKKKMPINKKALIFTSLGAIGTIALVVVLLIFLPKILFKNTINVHVFVGSMSSDKEILDYFRKEKFNEKVRIIEYDIWDDKDDYELYKKVQKHFNIDDELVPSVVIGDEIFTGFNDEVKKEYKDAIEIIVKNNEVVDVTLNIATGKAPETVTKFDTGKVKENKKEKEKSNDTEKETPSEGVYDAYRYITYGDTSMSVYSIREKSTKASEIDDDLKFRIVSSIYIENDFKKADNLDDYYQEKSISIDNKKIKAYYKEFFGDDDINYQEYSYYLGTLCGQIALNYNNNKDIWQGECWGIGSPGYPETDDEARFDKAYIKDNKLYIEEKVIGYKIITKNNDSIYPEYDYSIIYSGIDFKTPISDKIYDELYEISLDSYFDKASTVTYIFNILDNDKYQFVESIVK